MRHASLKTLAYWSCGLLIMASGALAQKSAEHSLIPAKIAELAQPLDYRLYPAEDRGAAHYLIESGDAVTFEFRVRRSGARAIVALSEAVNHSELDPKSVAIVMNEPRPAGPVRLTATVPAELEGQVFILQAMVIDAGRYELSDALTVMIVPPAPTLKKNDPQPVDVIVNG